MKFFKKSVALAGYKNKQCRKQTSVLSGRIVTAYVPLRSATERERAAFLIPCQGLRGLDTIFFTNFQVIIKPRCIHTGAACLLFQFPNVSVVLRNGSVGGEEACLGDVHQHHLLPLLLILIIGECLILYLDVIF